MYKRHAFGKFSKRVTSISGKPIAFVLSLALVVGWFAFGPYFKWSDSYSLFINTSTTIVTFLMVFLIQNSQNRESAAIQLKLDELIRANAQAHNILLDLEDLEIEDLEKLRSRYEGFARAARQRLHITGGIDALLEDIPDE